MILAMLAARRITLPGLVTHRFGLGEIQEAYDIFADAKDTGAMKVVMLGDEADLTGP